jgi:methionine-rich copper-binding protein CopC
MSLCPGATAGRLPPRWRLRCSGPAMTARGPRDLLGIRAAVIVLAAVLALALAALPAAAHNGLLSSNPSAGQRVSRAPAEVVLTFDEAAVTMGTRVVVTGPTGPVQQGPPRTADSTVTQPLRAGAPAGSYTVDWRTTSADGHPISGTFTFTAAGAGVGSGAPTEPAPSPAGPGQSGTAVVPWLVASAAATTGAVLLLALRRRRAGTSDPR